MDFELIFYKKPNGECPVQEFLDSLNKVMRFKMMHALDLLELYGNSPRGDFSRFVQDGICEVRAQTKTDITRVFYFFDKNRQIVLTNGYVKKTQRVSASDLETAKKYRADYLARSQNKEGKDTVTPRKTNGPQWRPKLDAILEEAQSKQSSQDKNKQKGRDPYSR